MAKSEVSLAFTEISEIRKLPKDTITDALKQALVSAYRRDRRPSTAQRVDAEIDLNSSNYHILLEKEVVEGVIDDNTEVELDDARKVDPQAQLGDMVMMPIVYNVRDFGRIAAQTAKQVISQKIRDAERTQLYDEFKLREGELVTGTIQSVSSSQITLMVDRAEAIMPRKEMIPGERYRAHEKIRILISEVKKSTREPQIVVSRGHKNLLRRLLEYEVPEIYNKQVEIKNIAREAGHRSKVAVAALQPGIDPLGACVGVRGSRIQNIVKELNDEKIDVIPWDNDQAVFISKALSPARVTGVYLEEDIDQGRTATVIVPDDQLSLAIGKEGQNARLAAKLTGWRIDIKSVVEAAFQALPKLEEPPLDRIATENPEMIVEVRRIIEKKRADRAVQPEEYVTLSRFVQMVEQRMLDQREIARNRRKKAMDKYKQVVPAWAYEIPLTDLDLTRDIQNALKNIDNCGDLMLRVYGDVDKLKEVLRAARCEDDAIDVINDALTDLLREHKKLDETAATPTDKADKPAATPEAASVLAPVGGDDDLDATLPAFVDMDVAPAAPRPEPAKVGRKIVRVEEDEAPAPAAVDKDNDFDDDGTAGGKKGKKGKKHRQLEFDEDRGEVVARRNRKRGQGFWGS
jgi:N utilization substance protein A